MGKKRRFSMPWGNSGDTLPSVHGEIVYSIPALSIIKYGVPGILGHARVCNADLFLASYRSLKGWFRPQNGGSKPQIRTCLDLFPCHLRHLAWSYPKKAFKIRLTEISHRDIENFIYSFQVTSSTRALFFSPRSVRKSNIMQHER